MPLVEKPEHQGFVTRVTELTSQRTPWCRRLWRTSTLRLGYELLAEGVNPALPESALKDMKGYLLEAAGPDIGVGEHREQLRRAVPRMRAGLNELSHDCLLFREHLDRAQETYLGNWAGYFESSRGAVDIESAARRIVSHLLDGGMHRNSLYAWITSIQHGTEDVTIADFVRTADQRLSAGLKEYEFCIPVSTRPAFLAGSDPTPAGWLRPAETTQWKKIHAPDAAPIRHQGSFLLTVEALDINAAVDKVRAKIFDLRAQFELGSKSPIRVCDQMWSRTKGSPFPTIATDRSIEIRSFERLSRLSGLDTPEYLVNALALVQPLRTSPPHLAITSGWSAIESLLVGDADEHDVIAAERFGAIVAASMLRAELTALAWAFVRDGRNDIAASIESSATNADRAKLMQTVIASRPGDRFFAREGDNLALRRIGPAIVDPRSEVEKISRILAREFTRLYRKRNIIAHAGRTNDETLHLTSEIMAPLIGAGVDRISHAGLVHNVRPIALSAALQARIPNLIPATADSPGNLVDLMEFGRA